MSVFDLLWLFFIISSLQPLIQQRLLAFQRAQALRALEERNGSRAIRLIHRREGFALLGVPLGGYIDVDDSEAVIRAVDDRRRRGDRPDPAHPAVSCSRPSRLLPPSPRIPPP